MKLYLIIASLIFTQFSFVQDGLINPRPKIWSLDDCTTNAHQNYLQAKYLNILYHQLLQFYQGNDIKL